MIFFKVSCILPGKPKASVNLLRKVFHTRLRMMTIEGDKYMNAMQAY